MRVRSLLLAAAFGWVATPAAAQLTSVPHANEQTVVVTGQQLHDHRTKRDEPKMSDWRLAETPHLLVFSKGDPAELAKTAKNLEKLHFLLSMLLNRVDEPDQTLKLSVVLIGDSADFDHLGLHNVRWQQGPYPNAFPTQIYYDPREDGPVLATTQRTQRVILQQGRRKPSTPDAPDWGWAAQNDDDPDTGNGNAMAGSNAMLGSANVLQGPDSDPTSAPDLQGISLNEISLRFPGFRRLYSAFAQHYLLTYFPAAYPRWYLEGFGEIFASMVSTKDGTIEYGQQPVGYRKVLEKFGYYPVKKILDGTYLNDKRWFPAFTPYTAWAMTHLLFFSDEWKTPLHNYLAAVARGAKPSEAARQLGDLRKLQREVDFYRGRNVPFERLTYPLDRIPAPVIRQLKESEAAYVRGHLELGARVTLPPAPPPGTDRIAAAEMNRARAKAIAEREDWLNRLRRNAVEYPDELVGQLLLAEAECRSGNAAPCLAAADRALKLSPGDPIALTWKGVALTRQAIAGPAEQREPTLKLARAAIAQANHADTESVVPLLAYYRSFADAGEAAPDVAVDGLAKAMEIVPSTPTTRLMLGSELARRSDIPDARRTLLPVAHGAFESPEQPQAQQILKKIASR